MHNTRRKISFGIKLGSSLFALIGLLFASFPKAATPIVDLQSVTVAYLNNFMKLSQWPSADNVNELTLCTVKSNDYTIDIDSLAGRQIDTFVLKVIHLLPGDSVNGCHLLFIPEDEKPVRVREWLKTAEHQPILTVSNMNGFIGEGGMIELVSDGNRLQFDVNVELADQAGIKMSSQMLQVARKIKRAE